MCGNSCSCRGTCVPGVSTAPAPAPKPARTLNAKLAAYDQRCEPAFDWLLAFLRDNRDEILTVARARRITGHFIYGDAEMFEYSRGRLLKEVIEEVADGVNYAVTVLDSDR